LKKSPTESVLVDLDLFCIRVLDPYWTRFLYRRRTWTAESLKRIVLPILGVWTVEEVLLKESYQKCPETCFGLVWTAESAVLLKESYTSWTHFGLVF